MSSIAIAVLIVASMIAASALIVDRIDQRTESRTYDDGIEKKNDEKQEDPPDDLVDLSGGMYGI